MRSWGWWICTPIIKNGAKKNHVRPFASRPFTAAAKEEIEIGMGRKLSHDLKGGNGKAKRGWKGVGILEVLGLRQELRQGNSKMGPMGP